MSLSPYFHSLLRRSKHIGKNFLFQCFLIAVIGIGFIIFPIRYPMSVKEENPDPTYAVQLDAEHPIQTIVTATDHWFSGIVFWTNSDLKLNPSTPLQVDISAADDSETVIRSVRLPLAQVLRSDGRTLRFMFRPISDSREKQYRVVLTAPELSSQTLPVRQPLLADIRKTPSAVASQLLTTQSLATTLKQYVLAYDTEGEDIFSLWKAGGYVLTGENPYRCILTNHCHDYKVLPYFPLSFWLSALTRQIGLQDYANWIVVWHSLLVISYLGIGLSLLVTFLRARQPFFALAATLFWLFNRWSLYTLRAGNLDFLPLSLLVLSILLIKKRYWLALLLFGGSLGIKQIAIFLVPIYLIYAWQNGSPRRLVHTLKSAAAIAAVPLLAFLPFLWVDPYAVLQTMLFSMHGSPHDHFGAPALEAALQLKGSASMLVIFGLLYASNILRRRELAASALMTFAIFLGFNTTLFNQHMLWLLPFIPLTLLEYSRLPKTLRAKDRDQIEPEALRRKRAYK